MKRINVWRAIFSGLLVAITPDLWAAITPSLVSVNPDGSGDFTWTYSVSLAQDQNAVGRGTAPGDSTAAGVGVISTVSDYFTIYDFAGYVPNSAVAPNADWSLRVSTGGSTPNDTIPTDNTSLFNLTWYLNSGITYLGPQTLGQFSARSIYNLETVSSFTGQGTRNSGAFAGTEISNIGTVATPRVSATSVPEPATFALLSLGLAGIAVARRRTQSSD